MLSKVTWVNLRRLSGRTGYSMELPDESSFVISPEALIWILDYYKFSNPESVADYAWNFKETSLDLKTGIVMCTYERNRRIGRP